jgi:threonine/homoserine/homoserine lactone efflux protein
MLTAATLLAFVSAALVVVLAPGPDTMYTVTRSLADGRAAGVVAALGTATGVLIHTAAAVAGLSALLRASAHAYTLVKYVGAAYLCYLGVRLLRSDETFDAVTTGTRSIVDSYRRAVTINVTNPKVAVFVLAFFPQFVPAAGRDAPVQMSILGLIYAGLSLVYLTAVALFAGRIRHHLLDSGRTRHVVQYASGSVLIGFGLRLLLEEHPTA